MLPKCIFSGIVSDEIPGNVPVAQRIEQQPSKLLVGVRFPPGTHKKPPLAQLVELLPLKEKVVGSNPTGRTINKNFPEWEVFVRRFYFYYEHGQ